MANGPPSSAAESSGKPESTPYESFVSTPSLFQPQVSTPVRPAGFHASTSASPYVCGSWPVNWSGYPTATTYPGVAAPSGSAAPYYNSHFRYPGYYPIQSPQTPTVLATQPVHIINGRQEVAKAPESPSSPPLESYRHWDEAFKSFLVEAGLHETVKGFENDMLVMSADWEQQQVPKALQSLVKHLMGIVEDPEAEENSKMMVDEDALESLDKRKLSYMTLTDGAVPRTPTSINKSIAQLLAKNRAKNNASNRSEFLYSLAERRRQMQEEGVDSSQLGSCARTDARPINRDEQMKYDIAKNDEGPLSRTIKTASTRRTTTAEEPTTKKSSMSTEELLQREQDEENVVAARYPALDERLKNIEAHFATRYVPSLPRTLTFRLKLLEDHIIKLEKEYPPWAALHFNQPDRGWPPAPRTTPIIVPPNLRSKEAEHATSSNHPSKPATTVEGSTSSSSKPTAKQRNAKSSLHRAVMEKLQVQQALNDLGNAD